MKLFDGILTAVNAKRSEPDKLPVDKALRARLAQNLRAARLATGLSQKELADLAGLSRKHLGGIERGVANVSIDVLAALAPHLGKTVIDLLTPAATA